MCVIKRIKHLKLPPVLILYGVKNMNFQEIVLTRLVVF